jgi:hypothetical protein
VDATCYLKRPCAGSLRALATRLGSDFSGASNPREVRPQDGDLSSAFGDGYDFKFHSLLTSGTRLSYSCFKSDAKQSELLFSSNQIKRECITYYQQVEWTGNQRKNSRV